DLSWMSIPHRVVRRTGRGDQMRGALKESAESVRPAPRTLTRGATTMRFMMLMIPKGYEQAAPGTMPDPKAVAAMMKYNEALENAGVLLALDGLTRRRWARASRLPAASRRQRTGRSPRRRRSSAATG